MEPLPLVELAAILAGEVIEPPDGRAEDVTVRHVATHSARIRTGAAFFALPGGRADGHDFVAAAAANGAVTAVVATTQVARLRAAPIPLVAVDDPLRALQRLAAWWRATLRTTFVAVTGSNGKTITKDCLVHLLSSVGPVYGTPGSYNSQLGVPLAVLECPREATVAVIEVAVSDPGEMAHVVDVVRPDHVVLTNVGTRWRYRFRDRAAQIDELLGIARDLPARGWVLLGQADDDLVAAARRVAGRVVVQQHDDGAPRSDRVSRAPGVAELHVHVGDGPPVVARVQTLSDEILGDVELAISAAALLGVGPADLQAALEHYVPTATRMEIWRSPGGVVLVRDVATPDPMAVASALRAARRLVAGDGRLYVLLAPPATPWTAEVAGDLARTLVGERADHVVGLGGPDLDEVARAAHALGAAAVRRFDSMDELRRQLVEELREGDVCLVQSPPGRTIDTVSGSLIEAMAPTRLYLDLSAMEENVTTFRRLVGPSVRLMAMVKALAYGTDAVAVSLGLHDSGIDHLGVAAVDEGIALRRAGVQLPILVMLGTGDEVGKMVRHRLTPLVYSDAMVTAVQAHAKERGEPFAVHVEVDSGMHRAGLPWARDRSGSRTAAEALDELVDGGLVVVEGLMTHLSSADDPARDAVTREQLRRFDDVVRHARSLGLRPLLHAAATAGATRFPAARYDMVRIGLGLFGVHPSGATAEQITLTPVLSLVSRIVHVIDVPAGEGVGYGGTYVAPPGGGRVGVVPAGYHDGVPRAASNRGSVLVAGRRCAIVGNVSMDSMTVDISACPEATVGSDVLIFGRRDDARVPLEDVAEAVGTIPYEVMARVGPRVQRIFTRH
jgi:alanine racemase